MRDHIAHRKTQSELKTTFERLATLDKATASTAALTNTLRSRLDTTSTDLRSELSGGFARVDGLTAVVKTLSENTNRADCERKDDMQQVRNAALSAHKSAVKVNDDVKASITLLETLVAGKYLSLCGKRAGRTLELPLEMRGMREELAQERADRREELARAQAAAEAEVSGCCVCERPGAASYAAPSQAQAESVSRKRKRTDDEAEAEDASECEC